MNALVKVGLPLFISAGAVLGFSNSAHADTEVDKRWMIKVKASRLNMANKSTPIAALGIATDTIHISDETIPELDITYFWTPNWATELVLTVPQKHNVSVENAGSTALGTFKHLPPTLSMQYHFTNSTSFTPYVGVGVNYTKIGSVNLTSGAGDLDLERDSFGLALGFGVDGEG